MFYVEAVALLIAVQEPVDLLDRYASNWSSTEFSNFAHTITAAPGQYQLTIQARTSSPGGETVAIYPQTAEGKRGSPRILTVIATRQGNSATTKVTIPPSKGDRELGQLPIVVAIENASGRHYYGDYVITLMRK